MKKFWNSQLGRNILFVIILFAAAMLMGKCDSDNVVRIHSSEDMIAVNSKTFSMNIPYDVIAELALEQVPDLGRTVDGKNNDSLRTGIWENETWGEYHLCLDPDATNCIVAYLNDGRTFVFNRKNAEETENIYRQILEKMPN